MNVYLAMYSTEITAGAALLIGLALGAWLGRGHEWDKGFSEGYNSAKPQRDAKGRFTK
jgi:hypothetical protein